MKKLLGIVAGILLAVSAHSADRITATIAITNQPTINGMTLTVNGNVRTWTNNVLNSLTTVLTNLTATGSATNLYRHIGLAPFGSVEVSLSGPTNVQLVANCGAALTVTSAGNWASITYSTQSCATPIAVRVPITSEPTGGQQTNIASLLVSGINSKSTNSFNESSIVVSNLVGITNAQTVSGSKNFTNVAGTWWGVVTNAPKISGTVDTLTNGSWRNPIFISPTSTNGINYGNAFSSPGSAIGSEQYGNSAVASGQNSVAIGNSSSASADYSVSLGDESSASSTNATALGVASSASANNTTAVGNSAVASATNSTALGFAASAIHSNSIAIGVASITTAANQIRLGGTPAYISIPGGLSVEGGTSNITASGYWNFPTGSDVAFKRYALSSLANGNNAAVPVGTNVFVEVSGPSGAFTINGIAGGRDGKLLIILNQTGQNMTVAHDSGTDPTAANRIYTMTAADRATTGNGAAILIYSGAASRWILISLDQ